MTLFFFEKSLKSFSETPWSFLKTSKSIHYDTLTSVKIYGTEVKQTLNDA